MNRRYSTRSFALSFIIVAAVSGAAVGEPPRPTISITEQSVTVASVVGGGGIALLGLLSEGSGYYVTQREVLLVLDDDDRDGRVVYTHDGVIPNRSVFFAVDVTTGFWSAAAPAGYEYRFVELPPAAVVNRNGRDVAVRVLAPVIDVLHVRPGRGVWKHRSGDGGGADGDRAVDGVITASPADFRSVRGAAATEGFFYPGDVVILVDSLRREYTARTFGTARPTE